MNSSFRFRPTEEELVNHYLRKKKQDKDFKVDHIIPEIDIRKYEPWDLPGLYAEPESPYQDMFFFSPRDYKYINKRARTNRATERGFWKITGKERVIKGARGSIGRKKTLIFCEGRVPKAKKTNWVMHEYYLSEEDEAIPKPKLAQQRDFVLCRLSKKADENETSICAVAETAYDEWLGISCSDTRKEVEVSPHNQLAIRGVDKLLSIRECPQPEELELVFPALQLHDNISEEMDTEV